MSKQFFPITSRFPGILCHNSKKDHVNIGKFWQRLLSILWSFLNFLGSQGGLHDRVWHHMKFISFCALLFKEVCWSFLLLQFKEKNLHTFRLKKFFKKTFAYARIKSSTLYIGVNISLEEIWACIETKLFVIFSINANLQQRFRVIFRPLT